MAKDEKKAAKETEEKVINEKAVERGGISISLPKRNYWLYSTSVLSVLVIFLVYNTFTPTGMVVGTGGMDIGEAKVKDKVESFVKDNLLVPGDEFSIVNVTASNGLYKLAFTLTTSQGEQSGYLYASNDGKLLFISLPIDMSKEIPKQESTETNITQKDTPEVKMFVMSFCPYGQQAEAGLKSVVGLLGKEIKFEPHFVIYSNYGGGGSDYCLDKENKYCSMHGINELNEDVRQLCIWKYYQDKWWSYVSSVNKNCSVSNIEVCWEAVAKQNGIDVDKIKSCQKDEALDMLKAEAELNDKYGVQGSPTIIINDVDYTGGRSSENYKQAICSAFTAEPDECGQKLENSTSSATGQC